MHAAHADDSARKAKTVRCGSPCPNPVCTSLERPRHHSQYPTARIAERFADGIGVERAHRQRLWLMAVDQHHGARTLDGAPSKGRHVVIGQLDRALTLRPLSVARGMAMLDVRRAGGDRGLPCGHVDGHQLCHGPITAIRARNTPGARTDPHGWAAERAVASTGPLHQAALVNAGQSDRGRRAVFTRRRLGRDLRFCIGHTYFHILPELRGYLRDQSCWRGMKGWPNGRSIDTKSPIAPD